jgi:RNA polymerase sigma-70 factor (ECF subfamily)
MSRMGGDEANVVARARGGDMEAFRTLVERHSHRLFRLAYRITGNEADAEDVVQETFMRAHENLGRFEERADIGSWLHRIAANRAVDLIRRRRTRAEIPEPADPDAPGPLDMIPAGTPSPERSAFGSEIRQRLEGAMHRLTPNERAAFVLRHHEEMTIAEIGKALNLRENATKQSIFRAVRKLRGELGPYLSSRARNR